MFLYVCVFKNKKFSVTEEETMTDNDNEVAQRPGRGDRFPPSGWQPGGDNYLLQFWNPELGDFLFLFCE